MTYKFCILVFLIYWEKSISSSHINKLEKPFSLERLNILLILPNLKSPSMIKTDSPVWAKAAARLLLIKLFPSPASGDVLIIIFTSLSREANAMFVLILLIDSANNDFGFFVIIWKLLQEHLVENY